MIKADFNTLLAADVHFGHLKRKWNPKMAPYLHGKKNGVHIFDLNKTYQALTEAKSFLTSAMKQGKSILFVSTKQQSVELIREAADKCGVPYVNSKWIPGLLTNFKTIRKRVTHMLKLKEDEESGAFEKYTKKEALKLRKEIKKLDNALGGIANMEKTPDIVFVLDMHRDRIAVQEAKKIGATVVGIADSNVNPENIDFAIPGNDDAIRAITFFISQIEEAVLAGKKK